jgi:hypothetical protein
MESTPDKNRHDRGGSMFREIVKLTPFAAVLAGALWYQGIPLAWAGILATLSAPTLWLVQLVREEMSPR